MTTAGVFMDVARGRITHSDPSRPITGWRVHQLDAGRLLMAGRQAVVSCPPCSLRPRSLAPVLFAQHMPPHRSCQCGIRVVSDLDALGSYWDRAFRGLELAGIGWELKFGTPEQVVARVAAEGPISPGHRQPHDDPAWTVRAAQVRVLEVYAPSWVDAKSVGRQHPGVTVRSISELPGGGLEHFRAAHPPETTQTFALRPDHIAVRTPLIDVKVPRTWLVPAVVNAALDVSDPHPIRQQGDGLGTLIDRLVTPLTDLTDPMEVQASALGLGFALATALTAEAHYRGEARTA